MQIDENSFSSQFELEGEEQVRSKIARGGYSSARAYSDATQWLEQKSRTREARAKEDRLLSERQTRIAETTNQLGERQVNLTEDANRIAKEANHSSKLAVRIGILSLIVAVVAIVVAILK